MRLVNNSCNFHPAEDWKINVKHRWRNPPKKIMQQQPFGRQMQRIVGRTLHRTFSAAKAICPQKTPGDCETRNFQEIFLEAFSPFAAGARTPQDKRVMVAPKPSLSVKLTLLGKNAKKVDELGDKFKEVLRGPSTEPFGTPKRICPKRPDTPRNLRNFWNLGETLVKPWRSLGGTFCGTFWQPKTDLPHRTIEGRSAILPRNLYYG